MVVGVVDTYKEGTWKNLDHSDVSLTYHGVNKQYSKIYMTIILDWAADLCAWYSFSVYQ